MQNIRTIFDQFLENSCFPCQKSHCRNITLPLDSTFSWSSTIKGKQFACLQHAYLHQDSQYTSPVLWKFLPFS